MKKRWTLLGLFLLILTFLLVTFKKEEEKKEGKLVRVYVDVVGDLFHSGHIEFFKQARALGDVLVVGVIPDHVVRAYKREPIIPHDERVKIISSCRYVDEVIPNCPLGVTKELMEEYRIDLVVHGDDFDEQKAKEQYLPAIEKGQFKLVPYTSGISTTDIIEKVIEQHKKNPFALKKKDFFEGTKNAAEMTKQGQVQESVAQEKVEKALAQE